MKDGNESLPRVPAEYIESLIKCMGNGKKVKLEVKGELEAHFEDALESCESGAEKDEATVRLLEAFGNPETLAKLIRRGKKRCRPLWKKMLVRTGQGLVGLVVFLILYSVWFMMGDATFSVDYLARLNEMSRPVVLSKDNAWTNYEKSIELYVEPAGQVKEILKNERRGEGYVRFFDLSGDNGNLMREYVEQNDAAWEEYAAGSSKSYCFREYTVGDETDAPILLNIMLPHLKSLRDITRMGLWRAKISRHEGRPMEAAQICLAMIRCGGHWQKDKATLIEQLVGLAIVRVACEEIVYIVGEGELSSGELECLRQDFRAVFVDGFPQVNAEIERVAFIDIVQHTFTEGGPGGGHLIPGTLEMLDIGAGGPAGAALSLVHARRDSTLAAADKLYDRMDEVARLSPYDRHVGNMEREKDELKSYHEYRYALLHIMTPAIQRVTDIRYQGKCLFEAVDLILALKVWELEKGELPGSLAELRDGGFLKEVPDDPYSDGVLKYVKRDGDYLLYSFGEDYKDDGGKAHPERPWGRSGEGDRVFWPLDPEEIEIPKPEPRPESRRGVFDR